MGVGFFTDAQHNFDFAATGQQFPEIFGVDGEKGAGLVNQAGDLDEATDRRVVWDRFNAPQAQQLWYFSSVLDAADGQPMVVALGGGADSAVLLAAAGPDFFPENCQFQSHSDLYSLIGF